MVNKKAKGDKYELECVEILPEIFIGEMFIIKSPRTMKRVWTPKGMIYVSQSNDFFGLFDIIAKSTHGMNHYVQVKSNASDVYKARKEINKFAKKYCESINETYSIMLRVMRKGWVKFNCFNFDDITFFNIKGEEVEPFIYSPKKKK